MTELIARRDLEFLLYEWLDVQSLARHERFAGHSRETFDSLLDLAEELANDYFAPFNRANDLNEPTFDGTSVCLPDNVGPALQAFAKADLLAAVLPEDQGGLGLPGVIYGAYTSLFSAANISTAGYIMLTLGNARLLLAHGSAEQVERFVEPMIAGRFFGTMALSEPHAGSSLSDITTRAQPQADGTYRVFGQKMWISGGDHELGENIVHLVLAKVPGSPAGTKGISLFIVPKFLVNDDGSIGERNDVVLSGINHKMGFRGTVNTAPVFGSGAHQPGGQDGAVGYLVGEANRGLSYMFHMMNEARIGVGIGATSLGYTGYLKSLTYARERLQGRKLGAAPTDPQVPIIEHTDVRRMLLAQKSYVEGALALCLYCSKLVDELAADDGGDEAQLGLLIDVLTPIVKSWPSQWCLTANDLAIQVLGGAGYTRDHDVEQHYRDNRLNPIHEGSHGIQGLDLLGRKILGTGGQGLMRLLAEINKTCEQANVVATQREGEAAELAEQLSAAGQRLAQVTAVVGGLGDSELMMANATAYLEATGHLVIAWIWLEQFLAAGDKEGDFYEGKRQTARYFFRCELPTINPKLEILAGADDTALTMRAAWF